ncbi:MAG: metallophosphoesterase [Deltaproteobacteria bacterium]|nr:metallophosphoesterase [Deltaproteobacteria bacterium]
MILLLALLASDIVPPQVVHSPPVVEPAVVPPVVVPAALVKRPLGPVRAGDLVLVGAGDIADCATNDDDKTAVLVERVLAKSEKAWAFTLGDNVYPNGTQEEFFRCYEPTWGRFKGRTLPVVGNHDWRTANAAGFRGTFARRFTGDGPLWYSVDVEGVGSDGQPARWHVVVLDSNCDKVGCAPGSPQYKWLLADLKKNAATKCTVAMFHHPRFSSGPHGDAEAMVPLWAALDGGGVDLVLAGHDHTYERFAALNSAGVVVAGAGIPSLVIGTGGKSHYPIISARKHSVAVGDDFGVLQLQLDNDGWHSRFIAVGGVESDVAAGSCR